MAAKTKRTATAKPTVDDILNRPLPKEALKSMPHKHGLTAINPIYVTDRLNEAFGLGGWQYEPEIVDDDQTKMVVIRGTLSIPSIDARIVQFGGNDNSDRGDAYKGAATDALTKCASYLGIGAHVWRNDAPSETEAAKPKPKAKPKAKLTLDEKAARILHARLEEVLGPHEEAANKLLVEIGWLAAGKTFRDMESARRRGGAGSSG